MRIVIFFFICVWDNNLTIYVVYDSIREKRGEVMDNKALEYLLKNNPDDVLSKNGIKIRKIISPLFRKLMMLFTKGNLEIVRKGIVPKDKSIIYAGTHGFHDDIIFSMKTADRHAYLLYGSLLDFFKSFHGFGLWVNGVIIVDRKDKQSRKSSVEKMKKVIELGTNIIMFPEGTWNKNESIPVQKLYPGIYDVAKETGALVVPIATVMYGNDCYSIQGDAYDITNIDDIMSLEILKLQLNKIIKVRDLLIYSNNNENYIKNLLEKLLVILSNNEVDCKIIDEIKSYYPSYFNLFMNIIEINNIESLNNKSRIELIDNISLILSSIILEVDRIMDECQVDKDSINGSILLRSKNLLKTASQQKKLTAVSYLRDKMCTLKWDLYKNGDRNEFYPDYWKDYVEELIKTTNGLYDHDIEDIAEYKDPDEISKEDVFSILNNVQITKENAKVLAYIKK